MRCWEQHSHQRFSRCNDLHLANTILNLSLRWPRHNRFHCHNMLQPKLKDMELKGIEWNEIEIQNPKRRLDKA